MDVSPETYERASCVTGRSWFPARLERLDNTSMIWPAMASFFGVVSLFAIMHAFVVEPPVHHGRWDAEGTAWRYIRGPAALVCAYASCHMLMSAAYSSRQKRPSALAVALYCCLATYVFGLQFLSLIYRPFGLDLGYHVLIVALPCVGCNVAVSLAWIRSGKEAAMKLSTAPTIIGLCCFSVLWPVPRYLLKALPSSPGSLAAALTVNVVLLVLISSLTLKSWKLFRGAIGVHWTVWLCAGLVGCSWYAAEILYFLAAFEIVSSEVAFIFSTMVIVLQCLFLTVFVSQTVLSHEESERLKSERDAAQAQLALAAQLKEQTDQEQDARQKFLRYIFHEIRVPFNSIDMGLGMLLDDIAAADDHARARQHAYWQQGQLMQLRAEQGQDGTLQLSEDARATVEIMAKAAESMKVIINDTLDWTKVQSGSFQIHLGATQVADVVQFTLAGLSTFAQHPDMNVKINAHVDPVLPKWLLTDKVRLQQVVANFVSNAIKFAPHDGTGVVTVRVHVLADGSERTAGKEFPQFDADGVWWKKGGMKDSDRKEGSMLELSSVASGTSQPEPEPAPEANAVEKASAHANGGLWARILRVVSSVARYIPWYRRSSDSAVVLPSVSSPGPSVRVEQGTPQGRRASLVSRSSSCGALPAIHLPPLQPEVRTRLQQEGFVPKEQEQPVRWMQSENARGTGLVAPSTPAASLLHTSSVDQVCTVLISVKDNGMGISPSEVPGLFRAFRQLGAGMQYKGKGTGLGLAICHEIVSLHGGLVGVRSTGQPGKGAEFLVALPLHVLKRDAGALASQRSLGSHTCSTQRTIASHHTHQGWRSSMRSFTVRADDLAAMPIQVHTEAGEGSCSPDTGQRAMGGTKHAYTFEREVSRGAGSRRHGSSSKTSSSLDKDGAAAGPCYVALLSSVSEEAHGRMGGAQEVHTPVQAAAPTAWEDEGRQSPCSVSNDRVLQRMMQRASLAGSGADGVHAWHGGHDDTGPTLPWRGDHDVSLGQTSLRLSSSVVYPKPDTGLSTAANIPLPIRRMRTAPSLGRFNSGVTPTAPQQAQRGVPSSPVPQQDCWTSTVMTAGMNSTPKDTGRSDVTPVQQQTPVSTRRPAPLVTVNTSRPMIAGSGSGQLLHTDEKRTPALICRPSAFVGVYSTRGSSTFSAGEVGLPLPVIAQNQRETVSLSLPSGEGAHDVSLAAHPPVIVRILIVDDVGDNRKLLSRALKRKLEGALSPVGRVLIEEAHDGHIAVEMVTKAGAPLYDVITMDAEMPTMPGFTATKHIRAAGYEGAIFGCTGNALEEDQALFRACGVDDVFIKPLNVGALAEAVLKALERRPTAA